MKKSDYSIVTTKHRGVFCGKITKNNAPESLVLEDARCAISFGTTKGLLQLAQSGPTGSSRIGAPALEVELFDITSITSVSEDAKKAWIKS